MHLDEAFFGRRVQKGGKVKFKASCTVTKICKFDKLDFEVRP